MKKIRIENVKVRKYTHTGQRDVDNDDDGDNKKKRYTNNINNTNNNKEQAIRFQEIDVFF